MDFNINEHITLYSFDHTQELTELTEHILIWKTFILGWERFCFCFWDKDLLCNPDRPQTQRSLGLLKTTMRGYQLSLIFVAFIYLWECASCDTRMQDQRTCSRNRFSPLTLRVLVTEFRLSDWAAKVFTPWAILPTLGIIFKVLIENH